MNTIRVRFAPSPTGPLHIGGIRTALFNYLFARKNKGKFILRIEDTDRTRFIPEAENYIIRALNWCGLELDEGIIEGGQYGPYRQSDRADIYLQYAEELVKKGHAYYAFDTAKELENIREQQEAQGKTFKYDAVIRKELKNSTVLRDDETQQLLNAKTPYVIRFKMPANEEIVLHDLIREEIRVNTSELDDKILIKTDKMPTYHLANVVDDHLMNITHVIRGEEWLPSTPLHFLLYRSFEWEQEMPQFAHIPLILKPTGKGKLSKRDGEKMGFPVFPMNWEDPNTGETAQGFYESGYLPEAFLNILALLGWNPGDEQEFFSKEELINAFSLDRVGKAGARFDPEKAKWYNHHHLQNKSDDELCRYFQPTLQDKKLKFDNDYVKKALSLIKERAYLINDLWNHSFFFFTEPTEYDQKAVKKKWKEGTGNMLNDIADILDQEKDFTAENIKKSISDYAEKNETGFGKIMNPLRITLTGGSYGPDLFQMMEILGKDTSLKRIREGVERIEA